MSMHRDLLRIRRQTSNLVSSPSPPSSRASPRARVSSARGEQRQGASEAVHVAVRVRPLSVNEAGQDVIVSMDPSAKKIFVRNRGEEKQEFPFELPVWSCGGNALNGSPPVTQAALYKMVGQPLLDHAFEGFNSTLMVYGSTGSGKTYTMMGDMDGGFLGEDEDVLNDGEEGIVPRLCREMFQKIRDRSVSLSDGGTLTWDVHASYVEVYCEKISDLLNNGAPVTIREVITDNEAHFALNGAQRVNVRNSAEILHLLKIGNRHRKTASTAMNERSSRSHAIFVVELTEMLVVRGPDGECVGAPGKFLTVRLVDLAGSERVGEAGMSGQLFKEGVDINCSLFTLGMVIEALSDPSRRHMRPPYRDSTLTKILKDAFGGNSKTTMICTIAPTEAQRVHTVQTLQYGLKARRIVNKPCAKRGPSAKELRKASEEMLSLRQKRRERQPQGGGLEESYADLRRAGGGGLHNGGALRHSESSSEGKETSLGGSNFATDEERDRYRRRMEELEEEIERARARYREQGRELQNIRRESAAEAEVRLRALEAQFNEKENHLKRKGHEIQRKHRDAESRLKEFKNFSEERISDLLRAQGELKDKLHEKELAVGQRERELQEAQSRAEEEVSRLHQRMMQQERKWLERHKALEAEICAQEDKMRDRLRDAMERMRNVEEVAARRESELHRKWLDAQQATRELHHKLAESEAEKARQISQDRRETTKRESELAHKLEETERGRKALEREAVSLKTELDVLKEDYEMLAKNSREGCDAEARLLPLEEELKRREERLQQREEQAQASLDEVLKKQEELDRLHLAVIAKADAIEKDAVAALRERESRLQKREDELKSLEHELEARSAVLDVEARDKSMEYDTKESGAEALASRERRATELLQDELQEALQRVHLDMKQREEKFDRMEDDIKRCREQLENLYNERDEMLRRASTSSAGRSCVFDSPLPVPPRGCRRCRSGTSWPSNCSTIGTGEENDASLSGRQFSPNQSSASQQEPRCSENGVEGGRSSELRPISALAGESVCLWLKNMLITMEERSRGLLEDLCYHEYSVLKRMTSIGSLFSFGENAPNTRSPEVAARVVDRTSVSACSDHLRGGFRLGSICGVVPHDAPCVPSLMHTEADCGLRDAASEHEQLAQRIVAFERLQHQREVEFQQKDEQIREYLVEVEAMDRERMAMYRLKEEEHEAAAAQLQVAKREFDHRVNCMQQTLFCRGAQQHAESIVLQEAAERENIFRLFNIQLHKIFAHERNMAHHTNCVDLLRQREEMITLEEAQLQKRISQLKDEEDEWKRRRSTEETQILTYLLELQNEDMLRKQAIGEKGSREDTAKYCEDAERGVAGLCNVMHRVRDHTQKCELAIQKMESELEQQADAEKVLEEREAAVERRRRELSTSMESRERSLLDREMELEELTCRLKGDIQKRELAIQKMESELEQQADAEKVLEEREAAVERRRRELSTSMESRERSLLEQEVDLRKLSTKAGDNCRKRPGSRVAHNQEGSYYVDVKKLLEVCGFQLPGGKVEFPDGSDTPIELTDNLIDVIESLRHQLKVWIQKYRVLKSDEKLECERCLWQNNRGATVCRCCGNAQLV
ncbi:kinesin, putative [Trypanosoma brucei gambiense DAL972]|uniref:Kinesin, putative n=1 Tax=Trypanosoma brucei gambiense (strain MHOM/CI/86/DAL972) TaxID=679716 RepID=C9ZLK4_TRYB9|nr:kinesin, putative [Trypanosoma brucei gambiense DAL972]CBH10213.1 kinesin, putative [Trypanosoma brucei gambiense DAL972]|eukprot:XP_011772503.1 kinesin, putative [Trypanosoma brucei gambiense DAL972]